MRAILRLNKRDTFSFLVEWGVILLAFGYYISAPISILLNVDSRPINILYRAIVVAFFFVPFLFIPVVKKKTSRVELFFLMFWLIYTARLLVDLLIRDISYNNGVNKGLTTSFIFLLVVFNIILPFLVVFRFRDYLSASRLFQSFSLFLFVCTIVVFYSIITSDQYLNRVLNARFSLGADGSSTLNPIRISFIGFVSIFTGIFHLVFLSPSRTYKVLLGVMIGLGAFNLLLGGSRGPVLLLVISLLFLFIIWIKRGVSIVSGGKFVLVTSIIFGLMGMYFVKNADNFVVFSRIQKTLDRLEDGKKEERNVLYETAWNMFLDNPIWGDQFVTKSPQRYLDRIIPHNIILESFMSVGLIGSFFLVIIFFIFIYRFFTIYKSSIPVIFFYVLTMTVFIQSLLSGAIFLDVEFWVLLFLTLNLKLVN